MSTSDDELKSFMGDVRQSINLLTQLSLRSYERMDELEVAQANSERKIAALADAQIRTEAALANLTEKMAQLAEAQAKLAESQAHTDQRLDALIDIVRERRNGKSEE